MRDPRRTRHPGRLGAARLPFALLLAASILALAAYLGGAHWLSLISAAGFAFAAAETARRPERYARRIDRNDIEAERRQRAADDVQHTTPESPGPGSPYR